MHRYDLAVAIDRPVDVVWEVATDLARTPEWRTTITSIEPPDHMAVGVPFAGTTRLLGRTWYWGLEITAWDPPQHFGYVVTRGVATPTVEYVLEPAGAGTLFTMSGYIEQMNLAARLLRPIALRALRRETRGHLRHLKRIVEGQANHT